MAACIWACGLVPHGPGLRGNAPRVYQLWLDLPVPRPRIAWSTTSAASPRARAIGFTSNLTSAQITALNALNGVWARELPANWRTLTWGQLPAGVRNRALNITGGSPRIVNGDTLPVAFRKLLAAMDDGTIRSVDDLLAQAGEPSA